MRVLVEQTRNKAVEWLKNLGMWAEDLKVDYPVDGWASKRDVGGNRIAVTVLMGGEDKDEWDLYPERDAIIIGTQDMLLSRALNRGYGMSRYRWPVHFGLLNNDCLWVVDEVQLMGRGFTTSVQLQAFRDSLGTMGSSSIETVWMSATLEKEWLNTVDHTGTSTVFTLNQEDMDFEGIKSRISAPKTLRKASPKLNETKPLAEEILQKHKPNTRTLVVRNTVRRAVDLHSAIKKMNRDVNLILVHSRFRPLDRKKVIDELLKIPDGRGTIVISTQVVEAGVDISSQTMFTELAPWPSLIQRFGRCNRSGEFGDAEVYWIDVPTGKDSLAPPYLDEELDKTRGILNSHDGNGVGPASLPKVPIQFVHEQMIRRKDLL